MTSRYGKTLLLTAVRESDTEKYNKQEKKDNIQQQ